MSDNVLGAARPVTTRQRRRVEVGMYHEWLCVDVDTRAQSGSDNDEEKRVATKYKQPLTESLVRVNCSIEIISSAVSSFFCLAMLVYKLKPFVLLR
jgi:hypothetical protein